MANKTLLALTLVGVAGLSLSCSQNAPAPSAPPIQQSQQEDGVTIYLPDDTLVILNKENPDQNKIIDRGLIGKHNTPAHVRETKKKIEYLDDSIHSLEKYYGKVGEPFSNSLEMTLSSLYAFKKAYKEYGMGYTMEQLAFSEIGRDVVKRLASADFFKEVSDGLKGYGYTVSYRLPPKDYVPMLARQTCRYDDPFKKEDTSMVMSGKERGFINTKDGYLVPGAKVYQMVKDGRLRIQDKKIIYRRE